jgi:hypothetical protein
MKAEAIYRAAERDGVQFDGACIGMNLSRWERLMEGNRRGNKRRIEKILADQGHINRDDLRFHNPYNHLITDTHIIYVHSAIEHFFRICG